MMRPLPGEPLFTIGYQGEQEKSKPNVGNPISMLYYWLGKEGKQLRKLAKIQEKEQINELVRARFETEQFLELTGFTGAEVEDFRDHCAMSDDFVILATDYEFLLRVRQCLKDFNN